MTIQDKLQWAALLVLLFAEVVRMWNGAEWLEDRDKVFNRLERMDVRLDIFRGELDAIKRYRE